MHISNTNEYFFPILYTCIKYNPLMNPVKFRQDQIQNGRLIAILFAQIDIIFENIWKFCPSGWISPTPMNICFQHFTHAWTTSLPWILWSDVRIKFKMANLLLFCLLKLTKYLKKLSVRMHISNTNEYCFPILYTCINYNPPMNPVKFPQDQI